MNKLRCLFVCLLFGLGTNLLKADCTATQDCSQCNSGNFKVSCVCVSNSTWSCDNCNSGGCGGPSNCLRCCGHDPRGGGTHCSAAGCSGNCLNPNVVNRGGEPDLAMLSKRMSLPPTSQLSVLGQIDSPSRLAPNLIPSINYETFSAQNLSVSDLYIESKDEVFTGLSFNLGSRNSQPVVALSIAVDTYWSGKTEPVRFFRTIDAWFFHEEAIAANGAIDEQIHTSVTSSQGLKLERVVLSLDYIEYENGLFTGPSLGLSHQMLQASRHEQLVLQKELVGILKTSSSNEEFKNWFVNRINQPDEPAGSFRAYRVATDVLNSFGFEALKQKLLREPRPL